MTYQDHFSADALADHAEGLLGKSEAGRVEAHLSGCDDCRATSLLLAAIPDILAADDVGPMPEHYAARIDAALADLMAGPLVPLAEAAVATPILATPITHDPSTNVVDLASRRKVALVGLRRVATVAAGVVLLIAGAALGIQTVGNDKEFVGPTGESELALPATRPGDESSRRTLAKLPTAPKDSKPGRSGSKIGPDGTIYLKEGKVLFPDGTVVMPGKTQNDPPIVLSPKKPKIEANPVTEPAKKPGSASTAKGRADAKLRAKQAIGDPAEPGGAGSPATAKPAAPATPAPVAPQPAATAGADGADTVGVAGAKDTAQASDDPYVSVSRSEYNEDNFAAKVMDLVSAARRHSAAGTDASADYDPAPTGDNPPAGSVQPDPSASRAGGPAFDPGQPYPDYGYYYDQYMSDRFAMSTDQVGRPELPARGPAEARIQDRVRRCAAQLGTKAIAGDIGLWRERAATVIVVPSDGPEQVIGYVFYGNCDGKRPATAAAAQWEQRVNRPVESPHPAPSPVRRLGSVHTGAGMAKTRPDAH